MRVVAREAELGDLARDAGRAERLAVDLEASGMFAYRAAICTVQLAWQSAQRLAVVDGLCVPLAGLRALLGAGGPTKLILEPGPDLTALLASRGAAAANGASPRAKSANRAPKPPRKDSSPGAQTKASSSLALAYKLGLKATIEAVDDYESYC